MPRNCGAFSFAQHPRTFVGLCCLFVIMSSEKRNIAILGSTGSIGTQALDVIAANPDRFTVEVLTAQSNATLLIQQALAFKPNCVVIGDESKYTEVKDALWSADIRGSSIF